jgi:hypothetical protein
MVSVPVLSTQRADAAPSISIAATRRVSTRLRDIRQAPSARNTVKTTGSSSGRIAIARVRAARKPRNQSPRAPVSWLTERDTLEGQSKLNFSEWDRPQEDAEHAAEEIRKGEMPLWCYVPLHPEAKLSAAERIALSAGLQATIGKKGEKEVSEKNER